LEVKYNGRLYIIEIKLIHYYDTPQTVREEGLEQIRGYRDRISPDTPSYLFIFDRRPEARQKSWDERITWATDGDIVVLEA
jgi:hypothetical protein